MPIKIILIVAAGVLLLFAFRHRDRVGLKAGWRILSVCLVLAAVAFIIDPGIPQSIADAVGVTRGTDLILYVLIVVFFFTTLGMYFRMQRAEQRLVDLARAIAVTVSVLQDGQPGNSDNAAADRASTPDRDAVEN